MYFTKCVPATLVVACLSVVGGLACWAATEATFSGSAFGEGGSTTITPNSLALGGGGGWLGIPAAVKYSGTFPVETLRIAFRKENPIDLFEVPQGSRDGRETSGQGVDRYIHVSFAV
jgi:hypothetical protein